jgi:predicted RNA-binding Zn-ribbon protein involved in translation (DUF1610 family)
VKKGEVNALQVTTDRKFCIFCGQMLENNVQVKFCPNCGSQLP